MRNSAPPIRTCALYLAQPLVRGLLGWRATEPFVWRVMPWLQRYAARHAGGRELVCRYDRSIRFKVDLTSHIESQIFWQGYQAADRGEMLLLGALIGRDSVIFDVGANVGVMSLYAARRAPEGQVHAFEPSSMHLERLKRNIEFNGFANIVVNGVALSDRRARRKMFVPAARGDMRNTGGTSFFASENYESLADSDSGSDTYVPTIRLDDYVADRGIGRLDVMKIDVEGAELEVLKGGLATLQRLRPIVLVEVGAGSLKVAGLSAADVFTFWQEQDYSVHEIHSDGKIGQQIKIGNLRPHQNICCWPNNRPIPTAQTV